MDDKDLEQIKQLIRQEITTALEGVFHEIETLRMEVSLLEKELAQRDELDESLWEMTIEEHCAQEDGDHFYAIDPDPDPADWWKPGTEPVD